MFASSVFSSNKEIHGSVRDSDFDQFVICCTLKQKEDIHIFLYVPMCTFRE